MRKRNLDVGWWLRVMDLGIALSSFQALYRVCMAYEGLKFR